MAILFLRSFFIVRTYVSKCPSKSDLNDDGEGGVDEGDQETAPGWDVEEAHGACGQERIVAQDAAVGSAQQARADCST